MARHADHSRAFTCTRKLPLPSLVGVLLSMRKQAQQSMLDAFFASLATSPNAALPGSAVSLTGGLPKRAILITGVWTA